MQLWIIVFFCAVGVAALIGILTVVSTISEKNKEIASLLRDIREQLNLPKP